MFLDMNTGKVKRMLHLNYAGIQKREHLCLQLKEKS